MADQRGILIEEVWEEDGKHQVFEKDGRNWYYRNGVLVDVEILEGEKC